MKKKNIIIWALICMVISIATIQYVNYKKNIEVVSEAPSEKWSKDKSISKGFVKSNPSIITFEGEIYIVHTTENGISLVKTNMQGDVIDAKGYDFDKFTADVTFTKDKENLYISWISVKKGVRSFNIGSVDNNLTIKDIRVVEGITECIKLSDEEILISSRDNIKIIDNNLYVLYESEKHIYDSISAAKYKEHTYIAHYSESDSAFYLMTLEDNKKVKEEKITNVVTGISMKFDNPMISINDEELILTYEEFVKGSYMRTKSISYSLSNGKSQSGLVEIQRQPVRGIIRGDSDGMFFGYVERFMDKRFFEQDIVEFRIKDGNIEEFNYVSNSRKRTFYIANYKEYVAFCEFMGINSYEVKLASSEELIKENTDFISKEEKKEALNISFQGAAFSLAYIFVIGITWLFFAVFVIGVISFLSYNFNEKMSKITYIGALILVGLCQLYMMKNIMYGKYAGMMPDHLSLGVGLAITLILYLISGIFSYFIFKRDIEMIPLIPFGGVLIVETFLVLSIFVPYIT